MKWAEKLSQALKRNEEKEVQKKSIREVMLEAIKDSVITPDELKQIVEICNSSNLTPDEIYFLRLEVFQAAVDIAIEDKRVTEEEETALYHIHSALQLPEDIFDEVELRVTKYRNLYELERGNLLYFSVENHTLNARENCHWVADVTLMKEKSFNPNTDISDATIIKKGLRYQVGSSKANLMTETDFVPVSTGVLYITNQRMIFSGEGKSFDIPYDRLIDIGIYNDGMKFSVSHNEKPYIFKTLEEEDTEAVGLLLSNAANDLL